MGRQNERTGPLRCGHLGGLFLCLVLHVWILHPFDAQTSLKCPLSSSGERISRSLGDVPPSGTFSSRRTDRDTAPFFVPFRYKKG